MQFTLFVPDLIWPEPDEHTVLARLATPALDDLLARSRLAQQPRQACETALAALFGHGGPVSYAALRHAGETGVADMRDASPDPLADGARWLCCDPVHLRFEQEHLILADAGHIGITAEEAQAPAPRTPCSPETTAPSALASDANCSCLEPSVHRRRDSSFHRHR